MYRIMFCFIISTIKLDETVKNLYNYVDDLRCERYHGPRGEHFSLKDEIFNVLPIVW